MTTNRPSPSELAKMDPRQINTIMTAKIRGAEPDPYADGKYVLRIVEVPGRTTGEARPFPIAVTQVGGNRYLCAPNRTRDWVRNLLAAGHCTVERDADYSVELVGGDEGAPVIATYLSLLGRESTMWPFPGNASVEEIREHTDTTAVIKLVAQ